MDTTATETFTVEHDCPAKKQEVRQASDWDFVFQRVVWIDGQWFLQQMDHLMHWGDDTVITDNACPLCHKQLS
jgi:hypothetical protein